MSSRPSWFDAWPAGPRPVGLARKTARRIDTRHSRGTRHVSFQLAIAGSRTPRFPEPSPDPPGPGTDTAEPAPDPPEHGTELPESSPGPSEPAPKSQELVPGVPEPAPGVAEHGTEAPERSPESPQSAPEAPSGHPTATDPALQAARAVFVSGRGVPRPKRTPPPILGPALPPPPLPAGRRRPRRRRGALPVRNRRLHSVVARTPPSIPIPFVVRSVPASLSPSSGRGPG